ncbi:MAG: hypothetical protein M1269_08745 [Chloroflexi bacterium]|nr:hypothetical protein [Chloroflexota bacterium]
MKNWQRILMVCAVFLVSLFLFFPRTEFISGVVQKELGKHAIVFMWESGRPMLFGAEFTGVEIMGPQGALLSKSNVKITQGLFSRKLLLETGSGSASLNISGDRIKMKTDKYPVPPLVSSVMGEGDLDLSGTYNVRDQDGAMKFNYETKGFPLAAAQTPLTLSGNLNLSRGSGALTFNMNGQDAKGKGNLNFSLKGIKSLAGVPVNGTLEVSLGEATLYYDLKGTLEKIQMSPSNPGGTKTLRLSNNKPVSVIDAKGAD